MTNALVPHPIQVCQGNPALDPFCPLTDYCWPVFPFWTGNGTIRSNRQVEWEPEERPGDEFDLPGVWGDRFKVTYYRPTPNDIFAAELLFPGQGQCPPWPAIYFKLVSYLPYVHVCRLKCWDALALFRWIVVCEQWQDRQRLQHYLSNLAATFEQIQKSQELILVPLACALWSVIQQRTTTTAPPTNKLAEQTQTASVLAFPIARVKDQLPQPGSQPSNACETNKATSQQSEVAAPAASQQSSPEAQPATTEPGEPADWVIGWRAIHDILRLGELWPKTTYQERRKRLKRLNESWEGPIIIGPKGRQPKVSRSKLLEWWNHLGEKVESEEAKQQDAAATVAAQYPYGRDGIVCPDIGGSVKQ